VTHRAVADRSQLGAVRDLRRVERGLGWRRDPVDARMVADRRKRHAGCRYHASRTEQQ